jgi:hypothetical protein
MHMPTPSGIQMDRTLLGQRSAHTIQLLLQLRDDDVTCNRVMRSRLTDMRQRSKAARQLRSKGNA